MDKKTFETLQNLLLSMTYMEASAIEMLDTIAEERQALRDMIVREGGDKCDLLHG